MADANAKPEMTRRRTSYVVRNQFGAFCSVCQSPLGCEEDDWDECDACGGEGIGGGDEDWGDDHYA